MRRLAATATVVLCGMGLGSPEALAAACPGADVQLSRTGQASIQRTFRCLINQARVHRHRAPLRANRQLARAGRAHGRDMLRRRYFAHVSPTGVTVLDRVLRARYARGGRYRIARVGQVLGVGFTSFPNRRYTPRIVVSAWLRSPSHRAALLSRRFHDVGTGAKFFRWGLAEAVVLATNFGRRHPVRPQRPRGFASKG